MENNELFQAIRQIVKEEVEPVKQDVSSMKSDISGLKEGQKSLQQEAYNALIAAMTNYYHVSIKGNGIL